MLLDLWGWVGDLKQGQATVLGLAGGFFTLVVGALINAGLNRRRDDRLRREDQRAVATALRAELEGLRRTLSDAAEAVSQEGYLKSDEQINVPDLAQSIQIMPEVASKFGLLDGTIISAVVDAYGMVEEYSAKLLLLGGRPGVTPDNFRRYVALPPDRLVPLVQLNTVTAGVIQKAIAQLDTTRTWREMSWPQRWHWLRSTG
jgi:hypothetical protein